MEDPYAVPAVARFTASFDSECNRCPIDIYAGDEMARINSDEYVCSDCADEEESNG